MFQRDMDLLHEIEAAKSLTFDSESHREIADQASPQGRSLQIFCSRSRSEFLKTRIIAEKIEHRIEPKQSGSDWRYRIRNRGYREQLL